MAKKFYVVWRGRQTGIFTDWGSCRKQVDKFPTAKFKSYPTREAAESAYRAGDAARSQASAGESPTTQQAKRRSSGGSVKTYSAAEVDALSTDTKIFTDGGCEPNPGQAGSGVAVYRSNAVAELWYGLYNPMGTNNTAELNALHQALQIAQSELATDKSVAIFCDSKYSIQCITQWAANWESNGWTKKGGAIKNLDLIKLIYSLYLTLKDEVQILHVNGHVGVEGNELADRMSILAMQSQQVSFTRHGDAIDIPSILALRAG
jgi:ribonuclease HI